MTTPPRGLAWLLSVGLLGTGVWIANAVNRLYALSPKDWRFFTMKSLAYGLFVLAAMPWVIRRLTLREGVSPPWYFWLGIFFIIWAVVLFFAWL